MGIPLLRKQILQHLREKGIRKFHSRDIAKPLGIPAPRVGSLLATMKPHVVIAERKQNGRKQPGHLWEFRGMI